MADTGNHFHHLPLPLIYKGRPKLHGGNRVSAKTEENLQNRKEHSRFLKDKTYYFISFWKDNIKEREKQKLPPLPKGIPLLLEIDPNTDIDYLRSTFGFEIVSEHDDGFVIVATDDIDFKKFLEKIEGFAHEKWGTGQTAKIYNLCTDDFQEERLKRILSEDMLVIWDQIEEESEYVVDVGIECLGTVTLPNPVEREDDEDEARYQKRLENYKKRLEEAYIAWDEIRMKREEALEDFVLGYQGAILSYVDGENLGFSHLPDSFTARIKINGKGLRDLVYNFPFLFEVCGPEILHEIKKLQSGERTYEVSFDIIPPDSSSPAVCIIDSGIQEEHKLLTIAIDKPNSHCFLPGVNDISDQVNNGGHGTRVAGAVLYPEGIPKKGVYTMPCWIQNARVLDENNSLPNELFPPNLMRAIVNRYRIKSDKKTRLYNHSIASFYPCRLQHMSAWAAEIDNLSYEYDVLFIQAAGNIHEDCQGPIRLGIKQHLMAGRKYPSYLLEKSCRIPNPAQSLQALTVGSICIGDYEDQDLVSLGKINWPSPFSATGPGIWNVIKPDVVEYGGGYVIDKSNPPNLTCPKEVCPELVRTSPPGPAFDRDEIGTSFAAPKVANIAAKLQSMFPDEPTLLYRALIAQSARWPECVLTSQLSPSEVLKYMGYGLPNLKRATSNSPYRVTLISSGRNAISARETHIYQVPIPESLRGIGDEYDILIEITLSYVAKPRRTRRNPRKYLSTWVDWTSSRVGESPQSFLNRILYDGDKALVENQEGSIPWIIGAQTNWGQAQGLKRNIGTLQKDWAYVKPYQLSSGFCIAVVGHEGWDKNPESKAYYSLVVSFEALNQEIEVYEPIRAQIEVEQRIETEIKV